MDRYHLRNRTVVCATDASSRLKEQQEQMLLDRQRQERRRSSSHREEDDSSMDEDDMDRDDQRYESRRRYTTHRVHVRDLKSVSRLSKTLIVKRLRTSLVADVKKKSKIDVLRRATTIRESTLNMISKAKLLDEEKSKKDAKEAATKSTNQIDPITREKIAVNPQNVFYFKRSPTSVTRMDAAALIDYVVATGDFSDPESRIPFDDASLARLDQIGSRLGKPSLLKAKKELTAAYTDRQFKRDALCGLERVCGMSVSDMFECVEAVNEHKQGLDEAQIALLTSVFPEFQHNFNQLADADSEFAKQSAKQFESFLCGPPNKPVKDSPIQRVVLETFRSIVEEAFI